MGAVEDSKAVMYAFDEGLIDVDDGVEVNFEYSEPGERKPEGVLDYCLQTLVDLSSDEVLTSGEGNVLEFTEEYDFVDYYAKKSPPFSLNNILDIMNLYRFDLEDPHQRDDQGHQYLGAALRTIVEKTDSSIVSEGSDRVFYEEGISETQVIDALGELSVGSQSNE